MLKHRNGSKGDSKTGSLDCESDIRGRGGPLASESEH